jgi:hypothetical protein
VYVGYVNGIVFRLLGPFPRSSADVLLTYLRSLDDAVSIASNVVNNELECMWKEAVVAHFKSLSCFLPEWAEENHENPQDVRCSCRGSSVERYRYAMLLDALF